MNNTENVAREVIGHLLERTRDGSITWSATVNGEKVGTFNRQTFVLEREDDFLDLLVKDAVGRTLWTITSFSHEEESEPRPVDVEEVPEALLKELDETVQVQLKQNHLQRMRSTLEALTAA